MASNGRSSSGGNDCCWHFAGQRSCGCYEHERSPLHPRGRLGVEHDEFSRTLHTLSRRGLGGGVD